MRVHIRVNKLRNAAVFAAVLLLLASLVFITRQQQVLAASVWDNTATPAILADSDTSAVELGMKFRSSSSGQITGVKFYKGAANTGVHTGSLWNRTGTRLATATFANETTSGWQTAYFASPVTISANTTYVVSYHAPNGRYSADSQYFANKSVTNGPITALQNGTDGPNGLYRYGSNSAFPNQSWQSTNYWVDPIFEYSTPQDTTAPTVSQVSPTDNAVDVAAEVTVTATFNEALNQASTTSAFTVTDANSQVVTGAVTYSATDKRLTFTPSSQLAAGASYTATLGTGITDVAGNNLASAYTWSFSTAPATEDEEPAISQSLWAPSPQTVSTATDDTAQVELGTRFQTNTDGVISELHFYKSYNDATSHTLTLWSANGTALTSATTSNETAGGWQTVTLGAPQAVTANTQYTVSYNAAQGRYSYTSAGLASPHTNGSLTAPVGGGVYGYGGGMPNSSWNNTLYWVDVSFTPGETPIDTTAPTVQNTSPAANAQQVVTSSHVIAYLSEPIDAATIANSLTVANAGGTVVPGSVSYDSSTRSISFAPTQPLENEQIYTATVATSITDVSGNHLASPYVWNFTTIDAPAVEEDLVEGPGGPILVVYAAENPFSTYYAEILRAEGLNSFDSKPMNEVTASVLSSYRVVIVGNISVSSTQASLLGDWVNAGGNLIAMHPDQTLDSLLGVSGVSGSVNEGYLDIDTSVAPGAGIVSETMQFHGSARAFNAQAGTQTVATLFNNATTSANLPAVTLRSVGTNGGQVSAFAYDLAQSVALTHQGNPAWSGDERDGSSPIRPNDLFYGAKSGDMQSDYINLNKVAIPQADEQQRLLGNIIAAATEDDTPLPKFWYFPNDAKAVVVLASDDHATSNGTNTFFNRLLAESPSNCNVSKWECYRATSYIYTNTALSNSAANAYAAQGFDLGVHVSTGCNNFTPTSLRSAFTNDLAAFQAKYPSLPAQTGSRTHCIAWSDYVSTPIVEREFGIRMDLNYYYWPGSWVQNRPGFLTGSGMSMRFANTDGNMIDVYQLPSHLVNESGQDFPTAINTQLGRALGPEGYYGALGTHFDYSDAFGDQLVDAAKAHNVPLVSAQQMLDWTDGRNASSMSGASWSGNTLSFTADADSKTNGMLRGMLPLHTAKGTLTTLTHNGAAATFTAQTIKGIAYAFFTVADGTFAATYATDTTAPSVVSSSPANNAVDVAASVTPSVTFNEALNPSSVNTSSVSLTNAAGASVAGTTQYNASTKTVTFTPTASLSTSTAYTLHITGVTDQAGNIVSHNVSFTTATSTPIVISSLWAPAAQAVSSATDDTSAVQLGLRFTSSTNGTISGIMFYKSTNDASTHTVRLWNTATGTVLATASTADETASGWQTASFAQPVAITAGTTYTASYYAPQGQYSYTSGGLSSGFTKGPLTALANGGVYAYSSSALPTQSWGGSNYWLDVLFTSAP